MHIFSISSLSAVISPDSFLTLIIICLFLCLLIRLGPFLASSVSSINSFPFLHALVLCFFFTNLLSSAYSTLSFSVLFVVVVVGGGFFFVLFFGLNSFLFLSKFSISVSSILFSIVDFCVWFCMVSIDSLRTVFIFSIDGSSSFRVLNLLFSSILKGVANFSNTLRSNQ